MNTKLIFAAVAAFVAMFLGGWLIWGFLLKDYLGMPEEEMNVGMIALAHVFIASLYAWIANATGATTLMKGLMNGFIVGLLYSIGMNIMLNAQLHMFSDNAKMFVDALGGGVWGALGMGAAGMVLGMGKKEA